MNTFAFSFACVYIAPMNGAISWVFRLLADRQCQKGTCFDFSSANCNSEPGWINSIVRSCPARTSDQSVYASRSIRIQDSTVCFQPVCVPYATRFRLRVSPVAGRPERELGALRFAPLSTPTPRRSTSSPPNHSVTQCQCNRDERAAQGRGNPDFGESADEKPTCDE